MFVEKVSSTSIQKFYEDRNLKILSKEKVKHPYKTGAKMIVVSAFTKNPEDAFTECWEDFGAVRKDQSPEAIIAHRAFLKALCNRHPHATGIAKQPFTFSSCDLSWQIFMLKNFADDYQNALRFHYNEKEGNLKHFEMVVKGCQRQKCREAASCRGQQTLDEYFSLKENPQFEKEPTSLYSGEKPRVHKEIATELCNTM